MLGQRPWPWWGVCVLVLAACGGGDDTGEADAGIDAALSDSGPLDSGGDAESPDGEVSDGDMPDDAGDLDTDGDGLTDAVEREIYLSNPLLRDTDGDGLEDGEEVLELGFDAEVNNYRFNPLIADLPEIAISVDTVPEIRIRYTTTTNQTATTSNASGGQRVSSSTMSNTGGISVSVGLEVSASAGLFTTGVDVKKSGSITGSWSATSSETTANHQTWNQVVSNSSSQQNASSGGALRVGASLENVSNLPFTVAHLTLVAYYPTEDGSLRPVATLDYGGGSFPSTSFAPGQQSNTLLFSDENLDLDTALELLRDARSLVIDTALIELQDDTGRPLAFDQGDVFAKTAGILIDYGTERPQERYQVATSSSIRDARTLLLSDALETILRIPTESDQGLTDVRGVTTTEVSRWIVVVTRERDTGTEVEVFDPNDEGYDVSELELAAGDSASLIYLSDADDDGLGVREEFLNGTDPNNADTDGDGRSDFSEVREPILVTSVNLIDPTRYPSEERSNPRFADADEDLLNDLEEAERGTDPNNADTDGDGIGDAIDRFSGEAPITGDYQIVAISGTSYRVIGTATPRNGTGIRRVEVDWGDGSMPDTRVSMTNNPLLIDVSHDYVGDGSYPVVITVNNNTVPENVARFAGNVEVREAIAFPSFAAPTAPTVVNPSAAYHEQRHLRWVLDMDDDGDADLVGMHENGVEVATWNGTGFDAPTEWLGGFGASGRHRYDDPVYLVDYNGDRLPDIVSFGPAGVDVAINEEGAFGTPTRVVDNFASSGGWSARDNVRTLGDADGNGFADVIGFGDAAVYVHLNGAAPGEVLEATSELTSGWRVLDHYRYVVDIDGDDFDDIVGFGANTGLQYVLGSASGTFDGPSGRETSVQIGNATGYRPTKHPVFVEDVTGDGKPDVVSLGGSSVLVFENESTPGVVSFRAASVWSTNFTYNRGYRLTETNTSGRLDSYHCYAGRHIRALVDLDGDGLRDLAAFGQDGVYGALNERLRGRAAFSETAFTLTSEVTISTNWIQDYSDGVRSQPFDPFTPGVFEWASDNVDSHWLEQFPFPDDPDDFALTTGATTRAMRLHVPRAFVDVDNDGLSDVVAFGNAGVYVQLTARVAQPVEQ